MNLRHSIFIIASAMFIFNGCGNSEYGWVKKGLDTARIQLKATAEEIEGEGMLPRSIWVGYDMDMLERQLERDRKTFQDSLRAYPAAEKLGKRRLCGIYDWTSGFYPGSLWYAYELTGDEELKEAAVKYTELLNPVRHYTGTHDLGFMMNCSYGNALRLSPNDTIPAVLINTADNLCSRFDGNIGAIRSWDFGPWNFPVIIDNMMNLDLLFTAGKLTGDPKYKEIAVSHADKTMPNHFREDGTSWHVISYNPDGTVECKQTFQGKNDDSAWARGQSWGVYGYTSCYRETGDRRYLDFAVKLADMIMERVTTDDAIPYWDYNAPQGEETPRDASAAAVTACALLEMSTMLPDGQKYFDYAEKILKSLSSDAYLAKPGTNEGFILKHSVGSLPNGSEIDVPLNYADYYYLEGLQRYMNIKGLKYSDL
ncbi:MAG: glycoside hydrolase family 88 protein [Bacteroidales bacterium]|nr:glycoside hydrolase family 88 protein [Bacteroidales bacterium]